MLRGGANDLKSLKLRHLDENRDLVNLLKLNKRKSIRKKKKLEERNINVRYSAKLMGLFFSWTDTQRFSKGTFFRQS